MYHFSDGSEEELEGGHVINEWFWDDNFRSVEYIAKELEIAAAIPGPKALIGLPLPENAKHRPPQNISNVQFQIPVWY